MPLEPPPQYSFRGLLLLNQRALEHQSSQAVLDPRPKALGAQLMTEAVEGLPLDKLGPLESSRASS